MNGLGTRVCWRAWNGTPTTATAVATATAERFVVFGHQIPEEDGVLVLDSSNFADAVAQVRYGTAVQCVTVRYRSAV